uniref:Uncharacterized protein n=1 Tax=Arundo donax TaxID=35708 RepID=A0A0A8Z5I0_ARUDO
MCMVAVWGGSHPLGLTLFPASGGVCGEKAAESLPTISVCVGSLRAVASSSSCFSLFSC